MEPLWEPLTEEELKFCWQCLVEQGQLTATKLQKFMQEVTGEELTALQATDLLGYLDATGDGRVGMEEFRHFMSSSELDMTDPQTFLWSPTKSFRERLGLVRVAEKAVEKPAEAPTAPEDPWGLFSEEEAPTEFSRSMDTRRNSLKKGKARRQGEPTVQEEDDLAILLQEEELKTVEDSAKRQLDEKALAKIQRSIEKHEQQTWEKLHVEQELMRKKLFSENEMVITSKEYHKRLSKMHQLGRSSMPGDLKPGDTLATLQYMLETKDGERPKVSKAGSGSSVKDEELLLPFSVWHRCMAGTKAKEEK